MCLFAVADRPSHQLDNFDSTQSGVCNTYGVVEWGGWILTTETVMLKVVRAFVDR